MTDQTKPLQVEPLPDNTENSDPITQEEILAIFNSPAVYIDHFYVAPAVGLIRMTFAEKSIDNKVKVPRFTALLSMRGLQELHNLTGNIIQQIAMKNMQIPTPEPPKPEKERLN